MTALRVRNSRIRVSRAVGVAWLTAGIATVVAACGVRPSRITAAPASQSVTLAAARVLRDREGGTDLWPGFDPGAVPYAIFDGARTLLVGHPTPPPEFVPLSGHDGIWAMPGRHPAVVANTNAELAGVATAMALPPGSGTTLRDYVGLLLHEAFHVHQRARHRAWTANEVELFTFPLDDARLLAQRRLETRALVRAGTAASASARGCWARRALHVRRMRFAAMPTGAVQYERALEQSEGLARYVEWRSTRNPALVTLPESDVPAEDVRDRAYRTGVALARLLDATLPTWRDSLTRADTTSLDALLARSIGTTGDAVDDACAFAPDEERAAAERAHVEVDALHARRSARRQAFLDQDGWRVVIHGGSAPLYPGGFDPLNVHRLRGAELLHTRFLVLQNAASRIEVLDRSVLTEGIGPHPLFQGVRTAIMTGLPSEPVIRESEGTVRIEGPGITGTLRGATVTRGPRQVTVTLPRG